MVALPKALGKSSPTCRSLDKLLDQIERGKSSSAKVEVCVITHYQYPFDKSHTISAGVDSCYDEAYQLNLLRKTNDFGSKRAHMSTRYVQ